MAARKKKAPPPKPNEARRNLVQWFYDLNKKGGAPRGMQDLCKGIKKDYEYQGPLVKQHLTYLVDLGYIHKEVTMTTVDRDMVAGSAPELQPQIRRPGGGDPRRGARSRG